MTERAVTLKVYEDGVPAHAQVFVHPEGVVADLLDVNDQVVGTAVYDRVDVEKVAERQGLEIEYVSGYADVDDVAEQPEGLSEASLEPEPPEGFVVVEDSPVELTPDPAADDDEPETGETIGEDTTEAIEE